MKVISWNINSVRLRMPLLAELVKRENPDVVCLQETKVTDELFPFSDIEQLGFKFIEFSGEKSYNGVAILSKIPLKLSDKIDICDFGHKRHISVILENGIKLHNFYIPAGGDIADSKLNPKFDFKLKFLDWMSDYFGNNHQKNDKLIIVGDFNIAPLENDVWSHKQLLSVVSHTPIEVEKLGLLQKTLDWTDTHRLNVPVSEKLYSWWSYRAKDPFKSNRGRRLDHIWNTPILKDNVQKTYALKEFRSLERPSDHIPIITKYNL